MNRVSVVHFSDVLCHWAYVGQARLDEAEAEFGSQVQIELRFCPVFGDAWGRVEKRWGDRGEFKAWGDEVSRVCASFGHVDVHADTWSGVAPRSSLPCHVFLAAIRNPTPKDLDAQADYERAIGRLRKAFFAEARDISQRVVQFEIAEELGLARQPIEALIASGQAHARVSADYELARELGVDVGPTLVLNQGRQRLNGNVGYRVIEANFKELLREPHAGQASWC
jgi:predicted DsbA family dithiol-disulfide isomerase